MPFDLKVKAETWHKATFGTPKILVWSDFFFFRKQIPAHGMVSQSEPILWYMYPVSPVYLWKSKFPP